MSIAPSSIYHRIHGPERAKPGTFPVILLHGLMGFAANWGKIWPGLEIERPVLVLDQRGHGRSPKPPTGYAPDDYAEDLVALMDQLKWDKAHIVGHSMGGRVALRFVAKYPERAVSLTMEDSGTAAFLGRVDWIKGLLKKIPTPFSDRETARAYFEMEFKSDPMTGSFLHANLETKNNGLMDWRFFAPGMIETVEQGRATDANIELASITQPTLLIRGSESREFPQQEAESMAKLRDNIKLVLVSGAGHYVHAQKPKEFLAALTQFLDAVETTAP